MPPLNFGAKEFISKTPNLWMQYNPTAPFVLLFRHFPTKMTKIDSEQLSPLVWGPPLWHVLFTFALSYPLQPNSITKRKYYDFIQNLPLFLPNAEIRKSFGALIAEYPVQPYLKTRDSFAPRKAFCSLDKNFPKSDFFFFIISNF